MPRYFTDRFGEHNVLDYESIWAAYANMRDLALRLSGFHPNANGIIDNIYLIDQRIASEMSIPMERVEGILAEVKRVPAPGPGQDRGTRAQPSS